MKKVSQRIRSFLAVMLAATCFLSGCGDSSATNVYKGGATYSREDALAELKVKADAVEPIVMKPTINFYDDSDEVVEVSISDISAYPITTKGDGQINIEIAVATELSAEDTPDDLANVWAKNFNAQNLEYNGKTMSVSIRKITSGEILTQMTEGSYRPDGILPSFNAWGKMLEASGFTVIELTDRLVGNTAGILMKQDAYDKFIEKHGEITLGKIIEAATAGEIAFGTTNPYTSSTGLNDLAGMLYCFDPDNPLSDKATQKLIEYQKGEVNMAYTTAILKNKATKGLIDAMVMEEQAYINTAALRDYVYIPFGVRHDHPFYTFDYVSEEKQAVAKEFMKYCLSDEAQKIADQKGFNRHDDYVSQEPGLDGAGYLEAQKVWKTTKSGGRPTIAVFVADISQSMNTNGALDSLKKSLHSASAFISNDTYIGLVSYSDKVYINLPIEQFDDLQKAYFYNAVESLLADGLTATYNATLVGLQMLEEKAEEVPNAKLLLIVLSDGQRNRGCEISDITNIVSGLSVPIFTIGYNLEGEASQEYRDELQSLSELNEATLIYSDTETIISELRNLFNAEM